MLKIYTTANKKTIFTPERIRTINYRFFLALLWSIIFLSQSSSAQQYFNSSLSTGTALSTGVVAPAGTSWSEVQLGNNSLGSNGTTGTYHLADNFNVCATWTINKFTFYGYITNLAGSISPFNFATVAIYNTDPSVGSPAPVFGDLTTNIYNTSFSANIYRVPNATNDLTRQLWKVEANVPSWTLVPGNYWVVFSLGNTQGAGVTSWVPLSTVQNTTTQPGNNAKQRTAAGVWSNITDGLSLTNQDIPFIIDYTAGVCGGTPNPGGALTSNAGPVCPSTSFTLSLTNPDCQSGVTYQWQYSTNGSASWTNITGATQSTLNATFLSLGISNSTTTVQNVLFRAIVNCANGGASANSGTITVQQNPILNCYCTSTATDNNDEDISNVTIGNLSNSSTCSSVGPGPGSVQYKYANYTSGPGAPAPANIFSGINNPFSVSIITCGGIFSNAVRIWIDLNRDGVLDNTTERVYSSATFTSGPHTESGQIFIPTTAATGVTLMRVVNFESFSIPGNACSNYSWGETEDYLVNITPATSCATATINPTTINTNSSNASVCPGVNFGLTLSQSLGYSGITYQWQSNTGSGWNNITGAINAALNTNLTVTTSYQCQIFCNGTLLGNSNPVTVNLSSPTDCYCNSSANNTADEEIINVTISSLNNSSTCTQTAPGPGSIASRYSNYTTSVPAPNLFAGINNPFSVSIGDCENAGFFTSGIGIWIDFNANGVFDSTEKVFLSAAGINGPYVATGNIFIPAGVSGLTRMRIVNKETNNMSSIVPCGTYGYGETEDYLVNIVPATNCSSVSLTPIGNTLSTGISVCPGTNISLSLQNTFAYVGITYQWQSSTDGTNYTNVPVGGTAATSGTQSTYSTSQTVPTYYQCQIFCNGTLAGNSTPVQVNIAPPTDCYCIPTANCASTDDILNVTIGSINNTTTVADCVSSGSNQGYVNYTSITPAIIFQGVSNPISVTVNAGGQESAGAWIDYDRNGVFDASEFTFLGTGVSNTTPLVFSNFINVPLTATTGIVRMRVRSKYFNSSLTAPNNLQIADNEACTPFQYGQTEDYLVNIQAANSCDNTYNPGSTISSVNPVCPSVPFTLTFSNTNPTSGVQYQWQFSLNGTNWTDITGATNINHTTTQTVSTYYRVAVYCQASLTTTYSSSLLVNINTNTAACYCIPPVSSCATVSITNVNFAGINNPSSCSSNGYINYTGVVGAGTATAGASNPVTIAGTGGRYTSIWIDYNRNGVFESSEYTGLGGFTTATTVSGNIAIPPTALTGTTLMRVRCSSSFLGGGGACSAISGETEDYRLNIVSCTSVQFEGVPGDALSTCGSNVLFSVAVSASTTPIYQWQVKTSVVAPWVNVVNGASGSATYSGATTDVLSINNVPLSFNGYKYRVFVNGDCTIADTSSSANLFVSASGTTTFTTQPVNTSIGCAGTTSFNFAVTTGASPVYQWQFRANATLPWVNMANGINGGVTIAGVATTTLSLTGLTNNYNGYQFRAYVSSPCSPSDTTAIATLTVTPITANLTLTSNQVSDTICNGSSVTFTASINFNGSPNYQVTASGSNTGTIIPSSTTNLIIGQFVSVISGAGAFLPNTYITAINPGVSFTVNQAPSAPTALGTVIGAYVFGFKFYVNNILQQSSLSNTYTTSSLTGISLVRSIVGVFDPTSCVPVNPAQSNVKTITVTPNTFTDVTIASSLGSSICSGDNVTFTATVTNGGSAPTFVWRRNGNVIAGATASTYSSSTLVNGDIITCVMTSNAAASLCSAPNPDTSNAITMTVNQAYPVSVNIAASPGVSACPGTQVTFTATPTNGGTNPAYQWYVNNSTVGTNSPTYTSTTLANNDQVKCVITSSITTCTQGTNPATSNILTMSISSQTASVSISQVPANNAVCAGASVTYTATPTNGGTTPSYQFYVNGIPVANTGNTYTYIPGANDSISVAMTSSFACVTPNPATAYVLQSLVPRPTASITPSSLTCGFNTITLDAGATAGTGTITGFSWSLGGVAISGATQSSYLATQTGNYTVTVTNSAGCTFTSSAYPLSSFTTPGPMSGNYTIGAVTATVSSFSGSTVTVNSSSSFSLGSIVSITSGPGTIPPNTIVTANNGSNQITLSNAPSGLTASTVIAGSTCTNYTSFRTAFADLNARSISGSCVFNVSAGFTETLTNRTAKANASSSGTTINVNNTGNLYVGAVPYVNSGTGAFAPGTYITAINSQTQFTVSLPPSTGLVSGDSIIINRLDLGSSYLNSSIGTNKAIVFQKSGSGANPLITAYSGSNGTSAGNSNNSIPDGIVALLGVDSVTFDGINLRDTNTVSTATMMEYGYGLFRSGIITSGNHDGAQRNTIKNCRITLNNANSQTTGTNVPAGSIGILVVADTVFRPNDVGSIPAGGVDGANSNNRFYNDSIINCNYGIALVGHGAATGTAPVNADVFNDIGGSTSVTGNTISGFGLSTAGFAAAGVYAANQWSLNVSNNIITSGSHGSVLRGINGVSGAGANVTINNNTINLSTSASNNTSAVFGIENNIGNTASSNTVNINNNTVTGTFINATSGTFFAIQNSASCTNLNMNGNNVLNTTYGNTSTTPSQEWRGVYNNASGCQNVTMNNNTISGNTINSTIQGAVNTSACMSLGSANQSAATNPTITISGNIITGNIRNAPITASSYMALLYIAGNTNGIVNVFNNTITNNTANISGGSGSSNFTLNNIFIGADSVSNVYSNLIRNNGVNINVASSGIMTNFGINTNGSAVNENIYRNTIRGLYVSSTSGTPATSSVLHQIFGINTYAAATSATSKGNKFIYENQLDTLYTNAVYNASIIGIRNERGGINNNFYKNKITSLWPGQSTTTNASQAVGIRISATATSSPVSATQTNINNNMIALSNLNNINSTADALRGIDLVAVTANMAYKVYHNSIRISGSSTGSQFSTSAIYHTIGALGAGTLDLRNNILVNESSPSGSGIVTAIKRSGNNFGNDSTICNYNILWAGSPQASPRWLYYDGTNNAATLPFPTVTFGNRELNSKSILPVFIAATNLHIDPCGANSSDANYQGTTPIATTTGITDDIDNETRVTPKIGADEFNATSFAGSVASNITVCSGANSGTLTLTGFVGSVIKWQSSTDSTNWIDLAPNTTSQQGYSGITVKTWYRAVVNGACGIGNSLPASVSVFATVPAISLTSGGTAVTTASVCLSSSIQFFGITSPAGANPWLSATTAVAPINATTGVAFGFSAGTSVITFTNNNGCKSTLTLTVTPLPTPITGPSSVCVGNSINLTGVNAGTWSSSNLAVATLSGPSATGVVVNGLTAGITNITYTSGGCTSIVDTITVNPRPANITGVTSLCVGASNSLVGVSAASWTTSAPAVATITNAGFITGVTAGSTTITYVNNNGCTSNTYNLTVNPTPTITGTLTVCQGGTTTLTGSGSNAVQNNASTPTTPWYSANSSIASLTNAAATSITVTGVAQGSTAITYTNNAGCSKTEIVTVNPKPKKYRMTRAGDGTYCTSSAGVLVGMDTTQASVNYQLYKVPATLVAGALVSGNGGPISFGVQPAGVYYAVATDANTGCVQSSTTDSTTITAVTAPTVSGTTALCVGSTSLLTYTNATGPAAVNPWISSNNPVITVDNSGNITAVSAGTANITFTNSTGCPSTPYSITVNPVSVGGAVGRDTSICVGQTLSRTLTLTGYTGGILRWESSNNGGGTWTPIVNTANTYPVGSAPASTTLYRAVVQSTGTGCSTANSSAATITINPLPDAAALNLNMTGGGSYCSGSNGVLVGLSGSSTSLDYQLIRTPSTNVGSQTPGTGAAFNFGFVTTAGTYTAQAVTSFGCRANITGTSVNVTITPLPVVKINQQGPINLCSGSSQVLTTTLLSGTAGSYQWYSYGTAIPGATGPSYTITGVGANLISVQALNNSPACNSLKSHAVAVTISTPPALVSSTPDTAEICSGGSQTINVTSQTAFGNAIAMAEDFNDTANIEWSVYSDPTSPAVSNWALYSAPFNNPTGSATFLNFTTQDGGWFAQADADAGGFGSSTYSILYSDTFSLANYTSASLNFEHALRSSSLFDNYVEIDISTDNGNTWVATPLRDYWNTIAGSITNNQQSTVPQTISLNSYLGQTNLMLRFLYWSDWGYYWIVDNVRVTGSKQYPTTYTWAPPAGLNVTTGAQVIASPSAQTSYVVSATSSVGCVAKDTSVVKIKPSPVITAESADTSICLGATSPTLSVNVTLNGTVSYQWYSNTANSNTGGTVMLGQIYDTLAPDVSTAGTTYYYAVVEDVDCNTKDTSRAIKVVVNPLTTITTEPTTPAAVCVGGTAPVLTVAASGAALTYQWYSNTTNTNTGGTSIPSATASSYTVPVAVADTFYYYVVVSGRCGDDTSAAVMVVVNPNTSITTQPVAPAAVCAGGTATPLTVVAAGAGTLTYQWYSNTTNSNTGGTSLGATAQTASYTPVINTAGTTYYYVVVTGTCGPISSNAVAVVVNPVTVITTEPIAPAAVCAGGTSTVLTVAATGTGTLTYQWYSNTVNNNTTGTSLGAAPGAQSTGYLPSVATAGTNYYYVIVNSACGSDTSAVVSVVVNANVSITTQPSTPAAVCAGGTATPLTVVAAGAGTLTYQWFSNTTNSNTGGTSLGAAAQTASYTPVITSAGTTYYYVVVTGTCGPISSNAVAVVVNPVTVITTEPTAPAAVCAGGTATPLSVVATGTGTLTYQWYSNTTNSYAGGASIGSATAANYTPSVATAGTIYYYVIVAGTCGNDTSAIVGVVVNAGSTAAVISGTATITLGNSTNLQVAITGGTSPYTVIYTDGTTNFTVTNYVSGSNISVSPTVTTTYTLVSVTSAAGCLGTGNTGSAVVTVNSGSTAAVLSAVAPTTICAGATANLQVAITGGISPFTIVYSDGTTSFTVNNYLTGTNIPVTPTVNTTYSLVSVTSTGGYLGTGNSGTPTITVTPLNTVTLTSAAGTNAQTICQGGAITNITYSTTGATGATFTGLPAGVTGNWAANVATISGTPTGTGVSNFTITLNGGCGSITTTGTITVTAANTITLSSAAATNAQTVCVNTAITNITYSTTGATGAIISGLPAGVTGNWAANVVTISGTPSASGPFNYTVTLTGGCGTVTANGSITVTPLNTVTLTSAAGTNAQTICQGGAITNITYSTTGATGATFTGLPLGVTGNWLSNAVTISGIPTGTGTSNYTVTLTGGCGTITATGSIAVNPGNSGPLAAGTYNITGSACTDFPSIDSAVKYLNTKGIANTPGAWIFNVPAGYVENAPTGGIALGSALLNGQVSSTKTITFVKNGAGANPLVMAYITGTNTPATAAPDGIWSLRGIDYVTIDGIDLKDANTEVSPNNRTMEYGYGLFKTSGSDGAQNNTIKNCTITLNRKDTTLGGANYFDGSVGIAVVNAAATSVTTSITTSQLSGANSFNRFFANTIQNCNIGIGMRGFAASSASAINPGDSSNIVGDSTTGSLNGNRIINFGGGLSGGGLAKSFGVYLVNQFGAIVANNTIDNNVNNTGINHLKQQYAIATDNFGTTGVLIKANTLKITGGGDDSYAGIYNKSGGGSGSTVSINNNVVTVGISPSVVTAIATDSVSAIRNLNPGQVGQVNINSNVVKGSTLKGIAIWNGIYNTGSTVGSSVINMNNNLLDSNRVEATGAFRIFENNGTANIQNMTGNTITRNYKAVSSASPTTNEINWMCQSNAASNNINIQNNLVNKDTVDVLATNGAQVFSNGVNIKGVTSGFTFTTSGNTIRSLFVRSINGNFAANVRGYISALPSGSTAVENVNNNKISNLYVLPAAGHTATDAVFGVYTTGAAINTGNPNTKNIFLNAIDTLYVRNNGDATPAYNSVVVGIHNNNNILYPNNGNALNIYKNKIAHLIPFGSSATLTYAKGIFIGSFTAAGNAYLYNNMVNIDLAEAFDGASSGALLANPTSLSGIDISYTNTANTFLYFNTVRIAGSAGASGFGSSAVSLSSASGTPNITLRNNIMVNKSNGVGTGKAVALRKTLAGIVYNNNSSNNVFYVDTTSATRANYLDVSTAFNTLSGNWITSGRETNSTTQVDPFFVKAADGTDSLHLNTRFNCFMNGNAVAITTPSITDDIDGDLRGANPDIGADQFTQDNNIVGLNFGQWAGVNSNWNDSINWCGYIPQVTTNVSIGSGRSAYPVINATTTPVPVCNNLTLSAGGTINNNTGGKMRIYGALSNTGGTFNSRTGTIELAGSAPQTLPSGIFSGDNLRHLIINNATVTLSGKLNLLGKLSFSGSTRTFNIGDSLLNMKSSDTLTAWLGNINKDENTAAVTSGNVVNGNAVVERYISNKKAWRLLSMPTAHNAQTIKQAWQEGALDSLQNPLPGYGFQITSNRTSWLGDGFDAYSPSGASVKSWNPALASGAGAYEGIVSTKSITSPVSDGKFVLGKAYMTFIRGDRTVTQLSQPATSTILREKGSFVTGTVTLPLGGTAANQSVSAGNPYAAPIDFTKLTKTNLQDVYYLWDPKVGTYGAYQTFQIVAGNTFCSNCVTGSSYANGNYYIQSGQGFFLTTTAASAGISFNEIAKVDSPSQVQRAPVNYGSFRTSLFRNNGTQTDLFDGVLHLFDNSFTDAVDNNDAQKLGNFNENLAISKEGKLLAIETRPELGTNDTLRFKLGQMRLAGYTFRFTPENINPNGLTGFLEDSYLQTSTPVSLTYVTDYSFNINSDPGSYNPDRFRIVFRQLAPVPVTFLDVTAEKVDKDVKVSWRVENEINIASYMVEKSADGRSFTSIGTVAASNLGLYSLTDSRPFAGNNFYRIRSVGVAGDLRYSRVVKVVFDIKSMITMNPNPVGEDRTIHLSFANMPEGLYAARIINVAGQTVYRTSINHNGNDMIHDLKPDSRMAAGNYRIELTNSEKQKTIIKFLY